MTGIFSITSKSSPFPYVRVTLRIFTPSLPQTSHFCIAGIKPKAKGKKSSPGQMKLPWDEWEVKNEEIEKVASKFILANCYNLPFASNVLQTSNEDGQMKQCQVSKTQNPQDLVENGAVINLHKNL